jgi:putative membrane protein insertion efficiency factor
MIVYVFRRADRRWDMPVAEPPCGACCYLFTDTPCGSCYSACTVGGADLGAWLALPEVIVRAVLGLATGASSHGSPAASASTRLAIGLIKGYRERISSRTAARCRYVPTCSAYGLAAVTRYGALRGCRMIRRRLARCRTSVAFGTPDPVPLLAGPR